MSKDGKEKEIATGEETSFLARRIKEALFIGLLAVAFFITLAFFTYHSTDPSLFNTGTSEKVANLGGRVGAIFAELCLYLFGYIAYAIPLAVVYAAWLILKDGVAQKTLTSKQVLWVRLAGMLLLLIGGCGLAHFHAEDNASLLPYHAGGILGEGLGEGLAHLLNFSGANLLLFALFLCGLTLYTGLSWLRVMDLLGQGVLWFYGWFKQKVMTTYQAYRDKKAAAVAAVPLAAASVAKAKPVVDTLADEDEIEPIKPAAPVPLKIVKPPEKVVPAPPKKPEIQHGIFEGSELDSLPALTLLEEAQHSTDKGYTEEVLAHLSKLVEEKLEEFGIKVTVVAVYPGPVITRFELDLAPGIKVSRLVTLSKDIARSLSFTSVRVVEVIPGKSYVGIEIPNQHREMVRLREVLSSEEYSNARSPLSLGLGVDIAGKPVVVDLAKMPHLLVAGTTGSGKSVGLNAMLLSLLYKSPPDVVRMIMVDPKMLELSIYDGIPHLLTPVITDMKKAANALRWAIGEMERRYKLMSMLGVRNLAGYNDKVRAGKASGQPVTDPMWERTEGVEGEKAPELEILPYIVVLVDEFADMMMVVGKKVDELIARLAQKARAAGIHLILATQRPSVDVITGLIKANIPTRIAFQVSSRIDSRTILDAQGAEQLLGHGDMLYQEAGMGQPIRVHGAFVADSEVHQVVDDLKAKGKPAYLEDITQGGDVGSVRADVDGLDLDEEGAGDQDPLFDQAVDIVAKTRRASISNVQRRLKIGYNRAARLLEEMEAQGMVTQMESNGTREVLLPPVEE